MAGHDSAKRVSLAQARDLLVRNMPALGVETIPVEEAAGRVIARPTFARLASPHYRAAAMDGIAVRAADTLPAADGTVVSLSLFDGEGAPPEHAVCRVVDTGNPLPEWADAVVRIEDARRTAGGYEVSSAVPPRRDIRAIGEDIAAGAMLLGPGRIVRAADVGAMLGTGVATVVVRRRPRIGVLATGGEVIEPLGADATPRPGQVIEFNSRMLAVYGAEWGAEVEYAGRVTDTAAELAARMRAELEGRDVLCVVAGSSAGRKDVTIEALQTCGELLFRGVDIAPGRPTTAARVADKIVLAVPGYPVSAVVAYRELLKPALDAATGRVASTPRVVRAIVRRDQPSRLGVEELVRVCLAFAGDDLIAAALPRGAGSIGTLVQAHGLLRIGPTCEGIAAGSSVDVELLDAAFDARSGLVVGGAGDSVSAALEAAMAETGGPLAVSYLGRADHDALAAVTIGEAHIALVRDAPASSAAPGRVVYALVSAQACTNATLVLSQSLAASPLGARVRAAVESRNFERLLENATGDRLVVERRQ